MAHYDCSNCGSSMGIGFGYCSDCTPKEYHELTRQRGQIYSSAREQANTFFKERFEQLEKEKNEFVESLVAQLVTGIDERIHAIKMEHDRGYRYQYEREQRTRMPHPVTGNEIHVEPGAQIPLFDKL